MWNDQTSSGWRLRRSLSKDISLDSSSYNANLTIIASLNNRTNLPFFFFFFNIQQPGSNLDFWGFPDKTPECQSISRQSWKMVLSLWKPPLIYFKENDSTHTVAYSKVYTEILKKTTVHYRWNTQWVTIRHKVLFLEAIKGFIHSRLIFLAVQQILEYVLSARLCLLWQKSLVS